MGRLISGGVLVAVAALALSGCSKEATPSAEQPKPSGSKPVETSALTAGDKGGPAASAEEPAGSADTSTAKASYSESNFDLSIKPKGEYKAGKEAETEIVLDAKAPFHANDKYPYKFKLEDTPGVTYPAKVVGKDKAKVEHMKVTLPVAFNADAGKKKIVGVFHFSVCTEDKCMIEKRPLAVEVEVK